MNLSFRVAVEMICYTSNRRISQELELRCSIRIVMVMISTKDNSDHEQRETGRGDIFDLV